MDCNWLTVQWDPKVSDHHALNAPIHIFHNIVLRVRVCVFQFIHLFTRTKESSALPQPILPDSLMITSLF